MKLLRFLPVFFAAFLLPAVAVEAQDFSAGDGFGFSDSSDFGFDDGSSSGLSVDFGGEVSAELKGFFNEMTSFAAVKEIRAGDIFSGTVNFSASGSAAEAFVSLNLRPVFDGSSPFEIDEAYLRAFFGPLAITGGIRKLSWGKADSFGPLDVINPLDYTDLSEISSPQSIKIARPMLHAAMPLGSFSKIEAVFVPWFEGHRFSVSGRWMPDQVSTLESGINSILAEVESYLYLIPIQDKDELFNYISVARSLLAGSIKSGALYPLTDTLKYAQAGLRFTASMGSSDFGIQYYFGRLPRPAISGIDPYGFFTPSSLNPTIADFHPEALVPEIDYNAYHHIGADFARVIYGFNLRVEAGANITNDLNGTDGAVYNPALVWSLGFDRDLFMGINLNLQGNGSVTLFHNAINTDPLKDLEAESGISSTRITGIISRRFMQEKLEVKATALWGIEDRDFLVMPALVWSANDVSAELSAGFFGGDESGELGQYGDNSFVKIILSYSF